MGPILLMAEILHQFIVYRCFFPLSIGFHGFHTSQVGISAINSRSTWRMSSQEGRIRGDRITPIYWHHFHGHLEGEQPDP